MPAVLASSKSSNQWPLGHNRLSTCSVMYQSLYLSSSWPTSSIMYIWIFFRCWCACLRSVRQFPDRQTKQAGGHGKEEMHCLARCV